MSVGVDVDIVRVGSTPLEMFVVALWLSVVGTAVVTVATQALLPVLRRRWPAVERLDPVEMLWAEAGGHVQRTFQGLDVESAREIAAHSIEARVPAGELIVEQGDAPIYFYILRDGEAEVSQRDDESGEEHVVRTFAAGDSFGEVAIVERTARTASVRARTDCVVLQIPAEDFVAAVSGGDDLAVDFHEVAAQYRAEDRSRRAAPADPAPPAAPAEAGRAYGVAHSATPYARPGDEPAASSPPSSEAEELSPEEEAMLQETREQLAAEQAARQAADAALQQAQQAVAAEQAARQAAEQAAEQARQAAAQAQQAEQAAKAEVQRVATEWQTAHAQLQAQADQTAQALAAEQAARAEAQRVAAEWQAAEARARQQAEPAKQQAEQAKQRAEQAPQPAQPPAPAEPQGWAPTHAVPAGGLGAWLQPDPAQQPFTTLDAGLPVQLLEWHGGWAHLRFSNGAEAWVEGAKLQSLG